MLAEAAWGVESEGFLLTVIALIFGAVLFDAVPTVGLLFRGLGRGHYTKNIPGFSDVHSVNPSVLEMSPGKSCPAFEGRVKLFPAFQRKELLARPAWCWFIPWNTTDEVWFIFKSFLFIIYDLTVTEMCGYLRNNNVCVLPFLKSEVWEWNQKWLPKNASKYIFSLLSFCPSAVAEVEQCGLELEKAPVLQLRFDGRGPSCWSFWKCLSFVYVKKYCASYLPLPFLPPSLNGPI